MRRWGRAQKTHSPRGSSPCQSRCTKYNRGPVPTSPLNKGHIRGLIIMLTNNERAQPSVMKSRWPAVAWPIWFGRRTGIRGRRCGLAYPASRMFLFFSFILPPSHFDLGTLSAQAQLSVTMVRGLVPEANPGRE